MKTILLKFSSPLQSWGTSSNFEIRETDHHPSKSAVIGLVAGAMGFLRDDERIKELNKLNFAVRVDDQGSLMRDYHIAAKRKPDEKLERNYVTNRYYLEDAVFVVALSQDDEFIDKIYQALQAPYYQSFLGRRSNPPTADFIIGIYGDEPIELLKKYPWQAREKTKKRAELNKKHNVSVDIYADSNIINSLKEKKRRDVVVSFSQKNRQHSYRLEKSLTIELPFNYSESFEIDFFEQIEG